MRSEQKTTIIEDFTYEGHFLGDLKIQYTVWYNKDQEGDYLNPSISGDVHSLQIDEIQFLETGAEKDRKFISSIQNSDEFKKEIKDLVYLEEQ